MTPAEAGAHLLEEPDWRELYTEVECADDGFDAVLRAWRRFHATPIIVKGEPKHNPASAVDGIIALARHGVFPPRSMTRHIPRGGPRIDIQYDEHCWIQVQGRAWRIVDCADRTMVLDSFGEQMTIDLNKAKWSKYVEAASLALAVKKAY